jgi:energy-coupling factor transporter ATP-binding protein EcfA2
MNSQTTTPAPPTSSEAAALAAIVQWSAGCPSWQRDALRRLCSKDALDEADLADLLAICKGNTASAMPLAAAHVRDPIAGSVVVTLQALHSIKNVNALADGERLSFERSGVTIIYGDNGSGKSGYARILKKLCRARSPENEPILPNIYGDATGSPVASIDFCVGGQNRKTSWESGETTDPTLSAISVFDNRTANTHVDQTNDVAYTPLPLKILASLAQACQSVGQKLNAEIKALEQQKPAVLSEPSCQPTTPAGRLIAGLTAKTKPETVTALAMLSDTEKARLETLTADLAGDPARAARQLQTLKARLDGMVGRLTALKDAVTDERAAALRASAAAFKVARDAASAASTDLFSGEPLPEIGSETWKVLWEAARAYSQTAAYPERPFPVTDAARCVLCHQELSAEAADRLRRFEAFIKDESKRKEENARLSHEQTYGAMMQARLPLAELAGFLATVRDDVGDMPLGEEIRRSALSLLWRLRQILRTHDQVAAPSLPPTVELPLPSLRQHAQDLLTRATALQEEKDSPARNALIAERDALADRAWLAVVKDDVLAQIERLKSIDALKHAAKDTATNRITTKSTEIAPAIVTNALRSRFAIEVDRLGVARLAIELRQEKTARGVPLFRVSLINRPTAKVGSVLSEGEHRCIALAAFLAELATIDARSAIVFDDPVSSLDHMHREKVAARLADEGLHRQVVVFTHDIAFLFLLYEACHEKGTHVGFRSINRGTEFAGFCQPNPPPNAQPVDRVIEAMRKQLADRKIHHERGNQEEWYLTVRSLQEQLRTTWERAVEDALTPVIKRLANKVDTKGLPKIAVLDMNDCVVMREAFGRCSELLHSQPEALNSPLPPPQSIETEIAALASWLASVRQRQDKAKLPV